MHGRFPGAINTGQHACSSTQFAAFTDEAIEQSLCARFAAQVVVHCSCLAVRDSQISLTFGELDGWAKRDRPRRARRK